MTWTPAKIDKLTRMWATPKLPASEIGERLGVTKNAVIGKVHRLGLPLRRKPYKRQLRRAA